MLDFKADFSKTSTTVSQGSSGFGLHHPEKNLFSAGPGHQHLTYNPLSAGTGEASGGFIGQWKAKGIFAFWLHLTEGGTESLRVGFRPPKGQNLLSPPTAGLGVE